MMGGAGSPVAAFAGRGYERDLDQGAAHLPGVHRDQRGDQHQINKILDACALDRPSAPVATSVGMDFFGDVVVKTDHRDHERRDTGETQQIRRGDQI